MMTKTFLATVMAMAAATTACGGLARDNHEPPPHRGFPVLGGDDQPDAGALGGDDAGTGSAGSGSSAPLCTPNTTTCSGGELTTCDATGNPSQTQACDVGCSADGSRCLRFVPSNGLDTFFQMTSDPQDLTLKDGNLDPETGVFSTALGDTTLVSFVVPASPGGAPLRVFVGKHVTIAGTVNIESSTDDNDNRSIGTAVALLATDELDVTGTLHVFVGAVDVAGCTGFDGTQHLQVFTGGGGGGHATAGAAGGNVKIGVTLLPHGDGGAASGNDALVPLRGGCPGGRDVTGGQFAGNGGGAVQLVSRAKVHVSGTINADGNGAGPGAGGGGGGGVLIEAPVVAIDDGAFVVARGGAGAAGDDGIGDDGAASAAPLAGATCISGGTCGAGGNGAAVGIAPTTGGGFAATATTVGSAGGGGGGLGRIRVNTATGTLTTKATLAAQVSIGPVLTE